MLVLLFRCPISGNAELQRWRGARAKRYRLSRRLKSYGKSCRSSRRGVKSDISLRRWGQSRLRNASGGHQDRLGDRVRRSERPTTYWGALGDRGGNPGVTRGIGGVETRVGGAEAEIPSGTIGVSRGSIVR